MWVYLPANGENPFLEITPCQVNILTPFTGGNKMKRNCIINGDIFRSIDDKGYYFINKVGDIYSTRAGKMLKHQINWQGYHRVDLYGKHCQVHRLVYQTWVGNIPNDMQVNHLDDNKDNNSVDNLYVGTQKQNITDCMNNNHKVGRVYYLTVYDKRLNKLVTICPAHHLYEYDREHTCKSRNVLKAMSTNWFRTRYDVIEYKPITSLQQFLELKGVSTKGDECSPVEQI